MAWSPHITCTINRQWSPPKNHGMIPTHHLHNQQTVIATQKSWHDPHTSPAQSTDSDHHPKIIMAWSPHITCTINRRWSPPQNHHSMIPTHHPHTSPAGTSALFSTLKSNHRLPSSLKGICTNFIARSSEIVKGFFSGLVHSNFPLQVVFVQFMKEIHWSSHAVHNTGYHVRKRKWQEVFV